jgi:pimeloyl-ACP methyl ester carboxylesterase
MTLGSGAGARAGSQDANQVPDLSAAEEMVAANPPQWQACGEIFECATLTVPLDYSAKVPGLAKLALVRLPTADPAHRRGSLVFNPGGPGGPAISHLQESKGAFLSTAIRDQFDIVAIDPRGIGSSIPLNCMLQQHGLDMHALAYLDPSNDAQWQQMLGIAHQIADACAQNAGPILPFMGTHEFTLDLEMLRIALGEPQLTFVMYSYGTQVGALYAERFPHSVRAMVLDSAVDMDLTGAQQVLEQARGREEVFDNFLEQCSLTPACAFFNDGDPGEAWDAFFHPAELQIENQAQGTGSAALDARTVILELRGLSRFANDPRNWGVLAELLAALQAGDEAKAARVASILAPASPPAIVDDNLRDPLDAPEEGMGFTAVECLDWQWPGTPEEFRQFALALQEAAPRLDGELASHLPCLFWSAAPSLQPQAPLAPELAPILVVGNTFDEATPYEWSAASAGQLESARLLTRIGVGHIATNKSDCIASLVDRYLVLLTLPAAGATCPTNSLGATWYVPPEAR